MDPRQPSAMPEERLQPSAQPGKVETNPPGDAELQTLKVLLRKLPQHRKPLDEESRQVVARVQQIAARSQQRRASESATQFMSSGAASKAASPGQLKPPSTSGSNAETPETIEQYKLITKLGEGGMGAVYKALHTRLNKLVALKILPLRGCETRKPWPASIVRCAPLGRSITRTSSGRWMPANAMARTTW